MIEIKNVKIDGLHCYEVVVTKIFHGPSHRPLLTAKLGLTAGGRPVGNMEVDDLSTAEELHDCANALLEAVEKIMLPTVANIEDLGTKEPVKPKSIIEEF